VSQRITWPPWVLGGVALTLAAASASSSGRS
jgi:hypothetical protein